MTSSFQYTVKPTDTGKTVQEFLRGLGYSKKLITDLKKDPRCLTIQQKQVYVTYRLQPGDILTVRLPAETSSPLIVPTAMDLQIVFEDEHLLVINKAANTPIHPSQGNYEHTLANGIAWYFQQQGQPFVYRVINRLDRDTTGLLILAKNPLSACILSEMVRERKIQRTYLAAVKGDMQHLYQSAEMIRGLIRTSDHSPYPFTLSAPIARVTGSTIERQVDWKQGEYACTHFMPQTYHAATNSTLVELKLETGRTHQIRVHMKYIGFPLYGDFLYHPHYDYIDRQSLHSWKLSFEHPITKKPLTFTAAVPDDMSCFF